MTKFKDGDQVIIRRDNPKTPKWILRHTRLDRPRRIVSHFYNRMRQHTLYYLGYNGRGVDFTYYGFMPAQLKIWDKGEIGRPREKRGYQKSGSRGVMPMPIVGLKDYYTSVLGADE